MWMRYSPLAAALLCMAMPTAGSPPRVGERSQGGASSEPRFFQTAWYNRFLNFVRNPIQFREQTVKFQNRKLECEKIQTGAVYVEPECLQYMTEQINFEPARAVCRARGGDLWVPDFNDPLFFSKLAKDYPDVLGATNGNLWVGIVAFNGRFFTVDGKDVTNTYWGILSNPEASEQCVLLKFLNIGTPLFDPITCGNPSTTDFICEYPLTTKDVVKTQKKVYLEWFKD